MPTKTFILSLIAVIMAFTTGLVNAAQKPNIVLLVADDLGYGDVGFHGSDIQTPNLDKLAAKGIRLEQFHVAPMCSPTRAGLMTGRYPIRFGMMRSVIPPYRDYGLNPKEDMLPEMLARAGYEYRACFGKWHLGHSKEAYYPLNQGFTHFMGCLNGAIDYFTKEREGELDWHREGKPFRKEGYATDLIGDEAVAFVESIPEEEPYFMYVPFNAPHGPFQAKEEDIAKYPDRKGNRKIYAAMVDSMDQAIGRIVDAIEKRGDADNTLVWFFSDNGGVNNIGENGPQRGSKLTIYQGGIRVAALAYWPDGGLVGGRVSNARIGYIDVMPTLKGIIGLDETPVKPFDGMDVLEAIKGNGTLPDRPWFTYLDQDANLVQHVAVNYDEHKLVLSRPLSGSTIDTPVMELFAIKKDAREENNLFKKIPELSNQLMKEADTFLQLQVADPISRYFVGKEGFVAPRDWQVRDGVTNNWKDRK
jgi:arylsulfatase A-like enzyme